MELILRCVGCMLKLIHLVITPFFTISAKYFYPSIKIPPIENNLLRMAAIDLAAKIRNKEIKAEDVVLAYINRIKEINPLINAMVDNRFSDAIEEAKRADLIVNENSSLTLLKDYPLLGVPFTVKESCGVKGLSFSVGAYNRKGIVAPKDGACVANLRSAGAIPLLVSNTPEFCTSWESNNFITGRTLNPHDSSRTSGGSSGGEGALLGAGASVFGIGSDVAGSIRIPAMFNGIFGHKPTGGVMSIDGHFPTSSDQQFHEFLVVGPMCRYAKDLPTLVHLMCGKNADKLRLDQPLFTKDINIFFMEDAGFSFVDIPVQYETKMYMRRAVQHFKRNGLTTKKAPFATLQHTLEIGLASFFTIEDIPLILKNPDNPKVIDNLFIELGKCFIGTSNYTFAGLFFVLLLQTHGFIPKSKVNDYVEQGEQLKKDLLAFLGDDGVLFYPTYPVSAVRHNESFLTMAGVMYTMIFNVLGFPSTHVPLGKDLNGRPVGIQVIAAPYQDRLCLCIAGELEAAFGGWVPPF